MNLVLDEDPTYPLDALEEQITAKRQVHSEKRKQQADSASLLKSTLSMTHQPAMDLAQEKEGGL